MKRQLKQLFKIVLVIGLCAGLTSCTLIRDGGGEDPGGGGDLPEFKFNDIPIDATVVDALVLVDLPRGAAGIAQGYYDYFALLEVALITHGIFIRNLAVAPLYRQQSHRPALLYGRGSPDNLRPSMEETLAYFVSDDGLAHLDSRVDTPGENLAALGMNLDREPIFNPSASGEGRAYFDPPEEGFLVFHLTGTRRQCSHGESACALNDKLPGQYVMDSDELGASWLRLPGPSSLPPENIIHISINTDEDIEYQDFVDNCVSEPSFPQSYLDFIENSPKTYYAPFMSEINSRGGLGIELDLCMAFSTRAITSSLHTASQINQHLH